MPITLAGFALKTAALLGVAVLPVVVRTNDGKVLEGNLNGFTEKSLLLAQDGDVVELAFDDLARLTPEDADESIGPKFSVTLVGGSKITAVDVALDDSDLLIEPRRQNQLRVPIKQVKSIRFRKSSVATDPQWLGLFDREVRGDTLVINRPGDRLDPQQGVIRSIEGGKVGFNWEGDIINAPIDRLEGVIFGGTDAVVEDADIQVIDIYGSKWSVIAIEPSQGDQPLQLRLSSSLLHELPLHHIQSVRWSGGVTLLAQSKPASDSFQPYFETKVDPELLKRFFGPARDRDADLTMVGGSSIEYRIDPGYRLLAGAVRRSEKIDDASELSVRIELDGETVWDQTLDDGEPRGFELAVDRARRLAIVVESGEDGDLGDSVRISRPRLLK